MPWYTSVPCGNDPRMSSEAKIRGHKTNHSLCETVATKMFRHDALKKLIQACIDRSPSLRNLTNQVYSCVLGQLASQDTLYLY